MLREVSGLSKIKIVTDSTADISREKREALGIEMVPLKVHFGTETYYDGIDISSSEFYTKLEDSSELPTTSQPSPVDFMELYKKAADEPGTEIISIHLSAAFSGTYQSALLAKSLLEEQTVIHIMDSRSASFGHGMLALTAAEEAKAGKSAEEILELIEKMRSQSRIYFIVDTLQYLYKGGRIGKASAMFGSLLNIKPILTIDDAGEVAPVDKVRGQKKAIARMIELVKQEFGDRPVRLAVGHAESQESAQELRDLVCEQLNVTTDEYIEIGPVIGTHTGPGTLAVFVFPV